MTNTLFSDTTFRWILTAVTLAASLWAIYDVRRLVTLRDADGRDPLVRDKRFGYAIGIALGSLGIVGVLRFHDVL